MGENNQYDYIYHLDFNSSLWSKLWDSKKLCLWQNFITLIFLIMLMKSFFLMKAYRMNENTLLWGKFITLVNIHQFDENLSLWWKLIILLIFPLLWKFVTLMKSHYFDENSSYWWIIPTLLNIDCFEKDSSLLIRLIKIPLLDKKKSSS